MKNTSLVALILTSFIGAAVAQEAPAEAEVAAVPLETPVEQTDAKPVEQPTEAASAKPGTAEQLEKLQRRLRMQYPTAAVSVNEGVRLTDAMLENWSTAQPGLLTQVYSQCADAANGQTRTLKAIQWKGLGDKALTKSIPPDSNINAGLFSGLGSLAYVVEINGKPSLLTSTVVSRPLPMYMATQTDAASESVRAHLPISVAGCPANQTTEVLEKLLDELFPEGGAGNSKLFLSRVSLGDASSLGNLKVPGLSLMPVEILRSVSATTLRLPVSAQRGEAVLVLNKLVGHLNTKEIYPVSYWVETLDGYTSGKVVYRFMQHTLTVEPRTTGAAASVLLHFSAL